jgi:hypothetical protein
MSTDTATLTPDDVPALIRDLYAIVDELEAIFIGRLRP